MARERSGTEESANCGGRHAYPDNLLDHVKDAVRFFIGDDVRRHDVNDVAQWSQQDIAGEELAIEPGSEVVEVSARGVPASTRGCELDGCDPANAPRIEDAGSATKGIETFVEHLLEPPDPLEAAFFVKHREALQP